MNVCWFVNDFDLHDLALVFFVVKNESGLLNCATITTTFDWAMVVK